MTFFSYFSSILSLNKMTRSFCMATGIIAPWLIGIMIGQAENGSIISFGGYLLISSFTFLPEDRKIRLLCFSALIFGSFATIGIFITLGSPLFFIFATGAAITQCISELRNGYLRMPFALATLAFFLSVNQIPQDGAIAYALLFTIGCFWGVIIAALCFQTASEELSITAIDFKKNKQQQRFGITMIITVLTGSILACFSPGTHPCWLPATALRVIKPTKEQTTYRIKARALGSLIGAATGGFILGLSPIPWLHALLVGFLIFTMLLITAKRYAGWTFCLTSVALAFTLPANGNVFIIAYDRVLLTAGGIIIVLFMLVILPSEKK